MHRVCDRLLNTPDSEYKTCNTALNISSRSVAEGSAIRTSSNETDDFTVATRRGGATFLFSFYEGESTT
jgi:hypothetical protein